MDTYLSVCVGVGGGGEDDNNDDEGDDDEKDGYDDDAGGGHAQAGGCGPCGRARCWSTTTTSAPSTANAGNSSTSLSWSEDKSPKETQQAHKWYAMTFQLNPVAYIFCPSSPFRDQRVRFVCTL